MSLFLSLLFASQVKEAPVTQSEAGAVFAKINAVAAKLLSRKLGPPPNISANQPATKSLLIHEFYVLLTETKPAFKFTPQLLRPDAKRFVTSGKDEREQLEKLTSWGFVAPYGPLSTGPENGVSIDDFGDSVGFFLVRLAELTHIPTAEFSPYLTFENLPDKH